MKITALETINVGAYPNITFVQVHTDDGLVGLGDTFHAAELRGTNAQLFPRLGDYAVFKVTGTEVVMAGLFDEYWQILSR